MEVAKKYELSWILTRDYLVKAGFALTGFLFSLVKIQSIRWVSYVSNVASLMVCGILVYQLPQYYDRFEVPPEITLYKFDINILVVLGACFFSFTNQFSMVTLIKVLHNDSFSLRTAVC
jgi:amino acid permease